MLMISHLPCHIVGNDSMMKKLITDWFTENDGSSWCIGRAMGAVAFLALLEQFIRLGDKDWQSFGISVSTIIAAVAAKNWSERK